MWAEILTQDDNSAFCKHLMVLTLKEKREGSADISVLTRTRLVKANPDIWIEEQRAGMAQKGTFLPGDSVPALGQLSRYSKPAESVPFPALRLTVLQYSPSSSSQLEERSVRFTQSTFSQPH